MRGLRCIRLADDSPRSWWKGQRTDTFTLRFSVVGRPFVPRTIVKVAFPLAAFESFIVIVFLAPAFSFSPADLPAIPGPDSVAVAETWARLRLLLRDSGQRMPVNDSWIAATAMALDVPVVTQDDDYVDVTGLTVIMV